MGRPSHKSSGSRKHAASHSERRHRTKGHPHPQDDAPHLKRKAYNGRELVHLLMDHTRQSSMFARLSDREADYISSPERHRCDSYDTALKFVETVFFILDKAFFFGRIEHIVKNLKILQDSPKGRARHFTSIFGHNEIHLYMDRFMEEFGDGAELQQKIVCVMLHEMLHAFIKYYTCTCRSCNHRVGTAGVHGKTGHGPVWCNSMFVLQEALNSDVPWDADCNVGGSVEVESNASGWRPSQKQLERWQLSGGGTFGGGTSRGRYREDRAESTFFSESEDGYHETGRDSPIYESEEEEDDEYDSQDETTTVFCLGDEYDFPDGSDSESDDDDDHDGFDTVISGPASRRSHSKRVHDRPRHAIAGPSQHQTSQRQIRYASTSHRHNERDRDYQEASESETRSARQSSRHASTSHRRSEQDHDYQDESESEPRSARPEGRQREDSRSHGSRRSHGRGGSRHHAQSSKPHHERHRRRKPRRQEEPILCCSIM